MVDSSAERYHLHERASCKKDHAEAQVAKLLKKMRVALPKIDVPVQLVHSRNDTYVPIDSMEKIYADLGTADKKMMWVTESGHVIPREPAKAEVFPVAAEFLHRVVAEKTRKT